MRIKIIVWAVRSACQDIGLAYRQRQAVLEFTARSNAAKAAS